MHLTCPLAGPCTFPLIQLSLVPSEQPDTQLDAYFGAFSFVFHPAQGESGERCNE